MRGLESFFPRSQSVTTSYDHDDGSGFDISRSPVPFIVFVTCVVCLRAEIQSPVKFHETKEPNICFASLYLNKRIFDGTIRLPR